MDPAPILVGLPIESLYMTYLVINTNLPCTVFNLWLIIGQISLATEECFTLTLSLGVIPCQYRHK